MYNFAVIGDPVEHSLSPPMHSYFMEVAEIRGEYGRIHVENMHDLRRVVRRLQNELLDGINITAPWKTAILGYLDEQSREAETIGAVNTVAARDKMLRGHNTDKEGFSRAVSDAVGTRDIRSVTLLGAGGSARAVLLGLASMGYRKIRVLNRTVEHAEQLIREFDLERRASATVLTETQLGESLATSGLVVNTLPPQAREIFGRLEIPGETGGVYYDLVYSGEYLGVLADFKQAGWQVADGLDMLIYQGIASLEYWTGANVEDRVVMDELRELLRNVD